jgi:hypothetical protein
MPPVALLASPQQARVRTFTLWAMWAHLALAVVVLPFKALQLGGAI